MNFPKDTEMKTTERKLKRISLYWRIFWRSKMSREPRRNFAIRTRFNHSFTNEKSTKIITSVHCVVWLPAVKGIWQNYGYIIIKEAEFEENANGLKVKDLKKNWRSAKSTSDVIFPECCIFTELRPIHHFNQSVARCITGKKMKQDLLQSVTKDYEY